LTPRQQLGNELLRHPRIAHQGLFEAEADVARLLASVPEFVPFRRDGYACGLWVLDWDHRLPSKNTVLRLFAYYSEAARAASRKDFDARAAEIAAEDIFPEFDVPDFSGLSADEAYESAFPATENPKKFKLVSPWRREVDAKLGQQAEDIVRESQAFAELANEVRGRPPGLGDVEAAEWSPPAESGHSRWGIDVWFLRSFNGMVGEGTAFLVDLQDRQVISQREFQFRAG
jgi:hypothetical protein